MTSLQSRPRRGLLGVLAGGLTCALVTAPLAAAPAHAAVTASSSSDRAWPGHPDRRLVDHRVRRGDTATGIAKRYHAWTAELLALNHLSTRTPVRVGERLVVPVVVSRSERPAVPTASRSPKHVVRAEIVRTAKRHDVSPTLALAVAWQESGWQQHVTSPVGAVGTMQVMPATGRWISSVVGRRLHLRELHDNVVAGVMLIRMLRDDHGLSMSLGGYYQGIGSIQQGGAYPSTRQYVSNVRTHLHRLNRGWDPLR